MAEGLLRDAENRKPFAIIVAILSDTTYSLLRVPLNK